MISAYESLLTRRSVRAYEDRQVPEDLLQKVLAAGLYAPTARDNQLPMMVVVQNEETLADWKS